MALKLIRKTNCVYIKAKRTKMALNIVSEVKVPDAVKEVVKKVKSEKKEKKKKVKEDPSKDADGNVYRKASEFTDYSADSHHACTGKGGCGLVKPKIAFVKDKGVKSGCRNICKACKNKSIRNKNATKNQTSEKKA